MNDSLPPSLNRFAAELEQAIRRELGLRRDHRRVRRLRAPRRLLAGSTIGAAGTGAVLAIVLSAAGSSPAFAVSRNRDGSYSVTLRTLSAIPAANRKLSQLGLHAVLVQVAANCPTRLPPLAPNPPLHVRYPIPIPTPTSLHVRIPPAPPPAIPRRHVRHPVPIPVPVCTPQHLPTPATRAAAAAADEAPPSHDGPPRK